MLRLAHLSDTHVCDRLRPQDLHRVLEAFLEQVTELQVDLIVHAGDFFDRRSTPEERIVLANFLQAAARVAPVFGVRGNHDAPKDLDLFNELDADNYICIKDRPTLPGQYHWMPHRNFGCIALPWFDKAHLVSGLEATVDAERTRLMTNEAARDLLIGLRAEAARARHDGRIPIVVSHAMVAGSEMSTGQVIQGTTVEFTPHDLHEIGAEYVALGHVHKTQEWFGGRVAYSGSPVRHNFGEPEEKGWRLVTFDDDGKFVSNEFRSLPAREIVLLEADWRRAAVFSRYEPPLRVQVADGELDLGDVSQAEGALVRFRYQIAAADLHLVNEASIRGILEGAGAAEVKIEAVVEHANRIRSEAIVTAQTTRDKVLAYFQAKGETLTPSESYRLETKLAEIEKEGA